MGNRSTFFEKGKKERDGGAPFFNILPLSIYGEGAGGEVKTSPLPIGRAIHGDPITFRIDIIYILPSPDIGIGFIGI